VSVYCSHKAGQLSKLIISSAQQNFAILDVLNIADRILNIPPIVSMQFSPNKVNNMPKILIG